jgi:hypothetical protein
VRWLKSERLWILAAMLFITLSTVYSLMVATFLPWIVQYLGWDLVILGLLVAGAGFINFRVKMARPLNNCARIPIPFSGSVHHRILLANHLSQISMPLRRRERSPERSSRSHLSKDRCR